MRVVKLTEGDYKSQKTALLSLSRSFSFSGSPSTPTLPPSSLCSSELSILHPNVRHEIHQGERRNQKNGYVNDSWEKWEVSWKMGTKWRCGWKAIKRLKQRSEEECSLHAWLVSEVDSCVTYRLRHGPNCTQTPYNNLCKSDPICLNTTVSVHILSPQSWSVYSILTWQWSQTQNLQALGHLIRWKRLRRAPAQTCAPVPALPACDDPLWLSGRPVKRTQTHVCLILKLNNKI